jgi:hypothetical protein
MPRDNNTMPAQDLANKLGGKRSGRGWRCPCPAHDDHEPSLDVTEGQNGKILVTCRAGCDQATVIDALRSRGLWDGGSGSVNGTASRYAAKEAVLVDVVPAGAPSLDMHAVLRTARILQRRGDSDIIVVDGTDYTVADVVRFDVKDRKGRHLYSEARILFGWQERKKRSDKTHRPITLWRQPDGQLEWRAKGYRNPGPLYGLETLDHNPDAAVVIYEGPGKSDRARELAPDRIHLSLMGGAAKAGHTDVSVLKDRDVVLWFDADEAGEKATAALRARIAKAGARTIGTVTPPAGVPKGWGIDDLENQEAAGDDVEALIADALDGVELVGVQSPERMDSPDDVLRVFNQTYAVVNEAGKTVVYRPKWDTQLQRGAIERILFEDFRRMYMNRRIQAGVSKNGSPIYRDVGTVWLEHEERRQFLGGVVMDPTGSASADCWNLWCGFTVEPEPGNWSLMYDHIHDVICGGDEVLFAYVLGWLARMVQHPDQPGEVALVLRGKKGAGKGTLGNWLIKLLGQHAVHVAHAKHLVGSFNAHLRDAVFVFADEAFFAGDKQHEGALKALVTEPSITIEAKHQNAVTMVNMTHILMASNSDWVVPATTDERRFCVMDVSDGHLGDRPYFNKLNAQMESGGLAAMLHDLLKYDLSAFDVRTVPQTAALTDQKRHSLDSLHRWWLSVLQRGFVWRSRHGAAMFTHWEDFVTTELLYRSYLSRSLLWLVTQTAFGRSFLWLKSLRWKTVGCDAGPGIGSVRFDLSATWNRKSPASERLTGEPGSRSLEMPLEAD